MYSNTHFGSHRRQRSSQNSSSSQLSLASNAPITSSRQTTSSTSSGGVTYSTQGTSYVPPAPRDTYSTDMIARVLLERSSNSHESSRSVLAGWGIPQRESYTQISQNPSRASQPYSSNRSSLGSNTPAPSSRETNTSARAGASSTQRTTPDSHAPTRLMSLDEMLRTPPPDIYDFRRPATSSVASATGSHHTPTSSIPLPSSRAPTRHMSLDEMLRHEPPHGLFPWASRAAATSSFRIGAHRTSASSMAPPSAASTRSQDSYAPATAPSISRGWTEPSTNSYYRSYGGWPNYMYSHGLKPWDYVDVEEGQAIREAYRDADRVAWEHAQHHNNHAVQSSARSDVGSQYSHQPSAESQSFYNRHSSANTPSASHGHSSTSAGSNYSSRDYSYDQSSTQDYTFGTTTGSTYHSGYAQSAVAPTNQCIAPSAGNTAWGYHNTAGYYYGDDDDDTSPASFGAAAASSNSDSRDADINVASSGFAEVIYEESGNASGEDEVYDSSGDYDGYDDQGGHSDYDGYSDGGDYDDDDYYSD